MSRLPLADVIRRVDLTHCEAVAITQQLIASKSDGDPVPPLGPPSIDTVDLFSDGAVLCRSCAAKPAVSEIARLLESMLDGHAGPPPHSRGKMPGALRYTLARAYLEVDAPPFDSLDDFSAALARQEPPDRAAVVAAIYRRAQPVPVAVGTAAAEVSAPGGDRRRAAMSPSELRRHLREADARLFATRSTAPQWALGGAMAALIAFGAGYAVMGVAPHEKRLHQPEPSVVSLRGTLPSAESRAFPTRETRTAPARAARVSRDVPVHTTSEPSARRDVDRQPALVRAVAHGPAFSPSFASNGSALFFHSGRSTDARSALESTPLTDPGLGVMTIVDDGAKNYHVQPSPDGTRVAFDSDRDGERGVYIAYRDGSGVRRVSGAGYAAVPTWSPDGKRLAFIRAEAQRPSVWNLWLLDVGGGESRRLTAFRYGQTWSASWFADGRRICYTHEDRLIVANLDTGASSEFASPVPRMLMRTPAVSPDGRRVIFQVARSGAWMLDLTDGHMQRVLADPTAEEFAWSPDGKRVAFHSRRDGQWSIWLLDRLIG